MKELQEMEQSGIIEPSQKQMSSTNCSGQEERRICADYRKLHSMTSIDAYPMPRTDKLIDKLVQAKYITTLDLARGYWRFRLALVLADASWSPFALLVV